MALYVKGKKEVAQKISGDMKKYDTSFCIGSTDGSHKFTACIDEVQTYNCALSQAEIQSIGN